MAKKSSKKTVTSVETRKATLGKSLHIAIIALVVNIIIPGVGSLIAGIIRDGFFQLGLALIGLIFYIRFEQYSLGLVLVGTAVIWGIYTGTKLIKNSQ